MSLPAKGFKEMFLIVPRSGRLFELEKTIVAKKLLELRLAKNLAEKAFAENMATITPNATLEDLVEVHTRAMDLFPELERATEALKVAVDLVDETNSSLLPAEFKSA